MNLTTYLSLDPAKQQDIINWYKNKQDPYNAFVRTHKTTHDTSQTSFSESNATSSGWKEHLAWAPLAIKDNILVQWHIASCASKMLSEYVAPYTATCATKLLDAWATILWHVNMDEFAMWSSGETSFFWPTKNPLNTDYVPWWSSSWSAAAVAGDLCLWALWSDTWWSIRQPAAFCGIVWVKPTYWRVSRYGVQAMASSLDQVWTLTKNVDDAVILLNTISGYDPLDAQSDIRADETISLSQETTTNNKKLSDYRFAIPREFFGEWLDETIKASITDLITKLQALWATVDYIDLPILKRAVHIYYVIMPAEATTNLQRFDGVKYWLQWDTMKYDTIQDYYAAMRSAWFGDEVKRRILLWNHALSSAEYERLYKKAQWLRQKMVSDLEAVRSDYDCILWPTTPTLPWKIWQKMDPLSLYLADLYTIPANLTWIPALSLPVGTHNWFSIWCQLMTKARDENTLLHIAKKIEELGKDS